MGSPCELHLYGDVAHEARRGRRDARRRACSSSSTSTRATATTASCAAINRSAGDPAGIAVDDETALPPRLRAHRLRAERRAVRRHLGQLAARVELQVGARAVAGGSDRGRSSASAGGACAGSGRGSCSRSREWSSTSAASARSTRPTAPPSCAARSACDTAWSTWAATCARSARTPTASRGSSASATRARPSAPWRACRCSAPRPRDQRRLRALHGRRRRALHAHPRPAHGLAGHAACAARASSRRSVSSPAPPRRSRCSRARATARASSTHSACRTCAWTTRAGLSGPRSPDEGGLAADRVTDPQHVAVGVAQRELARSPRGRGDRLGDRARSSRGTARRRSRRLRPARRTSWAGAARRTWRETAPRCGERTAPKLSPRVHAISKSEDVAVPGLGRGHVRDGQLRCDAPPHSQSLPYTVAYRRGQRPFTARGSTMTTVGTP